MNKVYEYCSRWGLDINYQKSKVMVFNKGSRISNSKFYIKDTEIESVRVYKYLGVLFSINGSFTNALSDMFCRGQKAFFKLTSIFKNMPCDVEKFMYVFDHTVKPVLLYSSEILGIFQSKNTYKNNINNLFETVYKNLPLEKVNLSMCRYVLSVNRKTSKLALYGELGRYPLYIDIVISMVKYWIRLNSSKVSDKLLASALAENEYMMQNKQKCWLSSVEMILRNCNLFSNYENLLSHRSRTNNELTKIKKYLKENFEKNWALQLLKSEKLRSYRTYKNIFKFENYLSNIYNDNERFNMTRLRTSNHRLHLETGRYTTPKTPINERVCKNCDTGQVEDEKHFLLLCPKYNELRANHIYSCYNQNILNINDNNLVFIWLMSNEDNTVCRKIAKYINMCFQLRNRVI